MTSVAAPRARAQAAPAARGGLKRHVRHRLRGVGIAALLISLPLAAQGFLAPDAVVLSFSATLLAIGFLLLDVSQADRGGLTPMTVYAIFSMVTSFANGVGLMNAETAKRGLYFVYAVDEYLNFAARLNFVAVLLPILGFRTATRNALSRALLQLLPTVRGTIPDRVLVGGGTLLAILAVWARYARVLPQLGTITALLFLVPQLTVFALARVGYARRVRGAIPAAMLIMVADALRAALSGYLRSEIIAPVFAFVLGALLGARSVRPLRSLTFVPIYALGAMFVVYFAAFAEIRSTAGVGAERFVALQEHRALEEGAPLEKKQTLLSRLSNFNQLTQVRRVAEEDGLQMGSTLDYLAFAFIPRFLWPEKPTVAKGAWFALRIGQANLMNGAITNSINMTVAGELYLNFGWAGALFGLPLFGVILAIPWLRADFWRGAQNTLGSAFGFFLMLIAAGAAADLQIVVTMIATYLLFVVASVAVRSLTGSPAARSRVAHGANA